MLLIIGFEIFPIKCNKITSEIAEQLYFSSFCTYFVILLENIFVPCEVVGKNLLFSVVDVPGPGGLGVEV